MTRKLQVIGYISPASPRWNMGDAFAIDVRDLIRFVMCKPGRFWGPRFRNRRKVSQCQIDEVPMRLVVGMFTSLPPLLRLSNRAVDVDLEVEAGDLAEKGLTNGY